MRAWQNEYCFHVKPIHWGCCWSVPQLFSTKYCVSSLKNRLLLSSPEAIRWRNGISTKNNFKSLCNNFLVCLFTAQFYFTHVPISCFDIPPTDSFLSKTVSMLRNHALPKLRNHKFLTLKVKFNNVLSEQGLAVTLEKSIQLRIALIKQTF